MKRSVSLLLLATLGLLTACPSAPKKIVKKTETVVVSAGDRKQAEDLYIKGVYAYAEGKTAEAMAAWKQCLKVNPEHSNARKALAEAKAKLEALKKLD